MNIYDALYSRKAFRRPSWEPNRLSTVVNFGTDAALLVEYLVRDNDSTCLCGTWTPPIDDLLAHDYYTVDIVSELYILSLTDL